MVGIRGWRLSDFPPLGIVWDAATQYLGIGIEHGLQLARIHIRTPATGVNLISEKISNDASAPAFQYRKARGDFTTPLALNTNDVLFNIGGFGHDGTSYGAAASASLRAFAEEPFTPTAHGTRFMIATCNIGASAQTEKVRITANGSVNIGGATTTTSKLNITGLPTSAAGLSAGDVWIDTTGGLNILKIV